MKVAIASAAALAVALWAGDARAHSCDEKKSGQQQTQIQGKVNKSGASVQAKSDLDSNDRNEGYGGSGDLRPSESSRIDINTPPAVEPARRMSNDSSYPRRGNRIGEGLSVVVGGGLEGFAGGLRDSLKPGPTWNLTAAMSASRAVGFELGYSGAVNESRESRVGELATGPDIIRNGLQAAATVGPKTPVQPYLLGGVAWNHFTVRGSSPGFESDSAGAIPLGAGIRTKVANFTADLRGSYNLGFDEEFAAANTGNTGRYQGTLSLGAAF
jgi:hypothetical protein